MIKIFFSAMMAISILLAITLQAQQTSDEVVPEVEKGLANKFEDISLEVEDSLAAKAMGEPVLANDWMVVAANPHAAAAGARVLNESGTAADAMAAVQAVLGLVEPQSSGLGGGAFLVWFDAESGELTTLDGRETAPLAATLRLFQAKDGDRLKFWDAVVGGRSVGVPGTPALMEAAHKKWGQNAWGGLFNEAIMLAKNGFAVSPRLAGLVDSDAKRLARFSDTADYFFQDGKPLRERSWLTNLAYANVMRRMAIEGAEVIYSGDIAQAIVDTVQGAEDNPGLISLIDLEIYEVKERPAVCAPFRRYQVCGMGPPSSGALTVDQILDLLDRFTVGSPEDPQTLRLIGDVSPSPIADATWLTAILYRCQPMALFLRII